MKINKLLTIFVLSVTVFSTTSAWAELSITLKDPSWDFLLHNTPLTETRAQLAPGESRFARTLQPLLAKQDHSAILHAFEQRNINNDSAALRLLRGQVLLSLKQYEKAKSTLKSALKLMPDLALAHQSLSAVYMFEKDYKNARTHLSRSIELGIADAQTYGQLAFVNLQLNQAASAIAGYQYALFLQADNDQWRQGLLYALTQSQAFDQAQALVEELIQTHPNSADLWLQRGQLALKQQRPQQAIASLETALRLGEKDVNNIITTAQLHIQSGSPRRAIELLKDHMAMLVNADKVEVLDQIAAWLAYQQEWNQLAGLITSLNKSKVELPSRYRSHFAVYQAQIALSNNQVSSNKQKAKQQQAAKQHLRSALTTDPSNGDALLILAKLLREQGQDEQAILYLIRAEALPLFKERGLLARSQLEIDRKNYPEALRLLQQVTQMNPNRKDVFANIRSLKHLVRVQG